MTKLIKQGATANTLKQLKRIERSAIRLERMREKMKALYESIDLVERDLLKDLIALGGQVNLGSTVISLRDPFTEKDGSFKNTVHRSKLFKRFEIEVEHP